MDRAQVGEPFVSQLRRPQPRVGLGVLGEALDVSGVGFGVVAGQVARQQLVGPAVKHLAEHLLLGVQQRDTAGQVQAGGAVLSH